jgi:hypothetical protein
MKIFPSLTRDAFRFVVIGKKRAVGFSISFDGRFSDGGVLLPWFGRLTHHRSLHDFHYRWVPFFRLIYVVGKGSIL